MDGLLINTETININTINEMLARYDRPAATPSVLAKLMGSPTATDDGDFHEWAKLPISADEYNQESDLITVRDFPHCKPLPGARSLLSNLNQAKTASGGAISVALASGTVKWTYELKLLSAEVSELLELIPAENRIRSYDPRMAGKSKKPAPDIFLLALEVLNEAKAKSGEDPILPEECLVFEDSIIGVEAGRRAGMRVVWVPHPAIASEYAVIEKDVLAGRTRVVDGGDDSQLGNVDDGWAEKIADLEQFNYEKYGIKLPN